MCLINEYEISKVYLFQNLFMKCMETNDLRKLEHQPFLKVTLHKDTDNGYRNILESKHYECADFINQIEYDSTGQRKWVMYCLST